MVDLYSLTDNAWGSTMDHMFSPQGSNPNRCVRCNQPYGYHPHVPED